MTELVKRADVAGIRKGEVDVVSTFEGNDFDTMKDVAKSVANAEPIADHLGQTINVSNVVMQRAEFTNEQTGEIEDGIRVILVDDKGKSYVGASKGMLNSIQTLLGLLPPVSQWPAPVPVKVVEKKARLGKFFTIELV